MSRVIIETFLELNKGKYYSAKQLCKLFEPVMNERSVYRTLSLIRKLEGFEIILKPNNNTNKLCYSNIISFYCKK